MKRVGKASTQTEPLFFIEEITSPVQDLIDVIYRVREKREQKKRESA